MPLYTYTCKSHGTFKAWNKMESSGEPQCCPTCATASPRALAAPAIGKSDDGFGGFAESDGGDFGGGGDDSMGGGGHTCGAGCMH